MSVSDPAQSRWSVKTAGGAAWRARYLYRDGSQVARIVLDPHDGIRPTLCLAIVIRKRDLALRLPLPWIPWRWCMATRYARPVVALYKAAARFWHNVDGRYGWGSEYRRAAR